MPPIAILTDFGLRDIYVGVMKGVIQGIAPGTPMIDLSHEVMPQNVRQAAFMLFKAYRYFPAGTVFLIVVDPGVGSARRAVIAEAGGYTFIAPDNGVLSYVLVQVGDFRLYTLENKAYQLVDASSTFHGRDIFAPAAAYAAAGVAPSAFGEPVPQSVMLPAPLLEVSQNRILGEVLHVDHFGNIITSIGSLRRQDAHYQLIGAFGKDAPEVQFAAGQAVVTVANCSLNGIQATYSEADPGDLLTLVGSGGFLEVSVNQGSAAARLGVGIGERIEVQIGD